MAYEKKNNFCIKKDILTRRSSHCYINVILFSYLKKHYDCQVKKIVIYHAKEKLITILKKYFNGENVKCTLKKWSISQKKSAKWEGINCCMKDQFSYQKSNYRKIYMIYKKSREQLGCHITWINHFTYSLTWSLVIYSCKKK